MDVTASSQIAAMAAELSGDGVQTLILKKALDQQSQSFFELLQGLPQKEGTGSQVDIYM